MPRDAHIPLFLWIATALLVHLIGGGGAHQAAAWVEDRVDLQRFVKGVRSYVRSTSDTIEISIGDEPPPEPEPESQPESDPDAAVKPEPDAKSEEELPEAAVDEKQETNEIDQSKEEPVAKKEAEKKATEEEKAVPEAQQLSMKKAISVRQHVKDKEQADNPDAEFLSEHNNKVLEQTQARITSNDQDDPQPTPGSSSSGVGEQPGNAHETRVAQSEDRPGEEARAPNDEPAPERPDTNQPPPNAGAPEAVARAHAAPVQTGAISGVQAPPEKDTGKTPTRASPGQAEQRAEAGAPELLASENGVGPAPPARAATAEQQGKRGQRKRELPRRKIRGYEDLLGLGASGTTASGINLNLTPGLAKDAIGVDQLSRERHADGARRRSQHLGSWKMAGIERWRSAIENYVPMVKPGNQTALNSARSPFATYLSLIHNRIHPIFADWFLQSLDSLPGSHPMNRPDLSTNLEIVLDQSEGRVVKQGVTKTSGVTAFDVAALESVQRAGPFGTPPREIVSPDGNVYLHWEFHRNPHVACTTHHARPYLLKVKPKPAPAPAPPAPNEAPPDERHGVLQAPPNTRVARTP